jgi:hypothetical protein
MKTYRRACEVTDPPLAFTEYMILLVKEVPNIRFIHVGEGALLVVHRKSDGTPYLIGFECLDNSDADWRAAKYCGTSWSTRPTSQKEDETRRKEIYAEYYDCLFEPDL